MTDNKTITGVHDFDWLYTQVNDKDSRELVDKIIAIEKSHMAGHPIPVSNDLLQLKLGTHTIWTRENTTHSIPFGYVQIFKLLDEILPAEFRGAMRGAIVDVGANEGHRALYMRAHHPAAPIIAIEPNPVPLELLRKNFKSNNITGTTVLPVAVGDKCDTREMETLDNVTSLGSFKIDRHGRPWLTDEKIRKIAVPCKRLDDLDELAAAEEIDLLKIDVEGAEVEVLEGASEVLDKTKRIEIEYGTADNRKKILEILGAHGFEFLLDHPYSPGRGALFLARSASFRSAAPKTAV